MLSMFPTQLAGGKQGLYPRFVQCRIPHPQGSACQHGGGLGSAPGALTAVLFGGRSPTLERSPKLSGFAEGGGQGSVCFGGRPYSDTSYLCHLLSSSKPQLPIWNMGIMEVLLRGRNSMASCS